MVPSDSKGWFDISGNIFVYFVAEFDVKIDTTLMSVNIKLQPQLSPDWKQGETALLLYVKLAKLTTSTSKAHQLTFYMLLLFSFPLQLMYRLNK